MPVSVGGARLELAADCSRCAGLCCVLPAFVASADFAFSKPAGTVCPHLAGDHRCGIHQSLRAKGFAGCEVYDCFGAGQHLVEAAGGGDGWPADRVLAEHFSTRFPVLRQLHELAWYLDRAVDYLRAGDVHDELATALAATEALARRAAGGPDEIAADDVEQHRAAVNVLLVKASDELRRPYGLRRRELRGADLVGADLRRGDLTGASLRGALLVGAQLQEARLTAADLTGADLRGASLHGADLGGALFLHPWQVTSAHGDGRTVLPDGMDRPGHWG